jgi:hypothetical protein
VIFISNIKEIIGMKNCGLNNHYRLAYAQRRSLLIKCSGTETWYRQNRESKKSK